jgi:hypothetical protein
MSASIWDLCSLNAEQEDCIKTVKCSTKLSPIETKLTQEHSNANPPINATATELDPMVVYSQENLAATELSCQSFVRDLDGMIERLDAITTAHSDVTGRTNSLMRNCEDLLERQVR